MRSFLLLLILCLIGCDETPKTVWTVTKTERIEPIVSVFMNKRSDYTAFVQKDKLLVAVGLYSTMNDVQIYADVEKGKPIFALVKTYTNSNWKESGGYRTKVEVELHIHSASDLQGGQWSYKTGGKYPQTITGRVCKII